MYFVDFVVLLARSSLRVSCRKISHHQTRHTLEKNCFFSRFYLVLFSFYNIIKRQFLAHSVVSS